MKKCNRCGEEKEPDQFSNKAASPDGLQSRCKACDSIFNKDWYSRNKKGRRNADLQRRYGISVKEYDALFIKQGGACAICGSKKVLGPKVHLHLCIDHCHKTKKVRGLLCHPCNTGLGKLGDTLEALRNATNYLEKHA